MRKVFTILFFLTCFNAGATNWYFSASGNDANIGNIGSPWRTIAKFNSVFASKAPGDFFLFNRGDVFYGSMVISRSGSSGLPITIGAYGTGANPVITGFTSVSAWTNLGANVWESTSAVSTLAQLNMVLINGVNIAMGRYPNSGWLTYQSFSTSTSITSSSINSAVTNWTGAEVVIRKASWIMDRGPITSHSGGTLNYITGTFSPVYNGVNGHGFFIQNDTRTLDAANEWYYSSTTKKIRIYSTSSPSSVQVTTVDTLVKINARNYITFDGVTFTGSNKMMFQTNGSNIKIQNCNLYYNGVDGVWGSGAQSANTSPNFIFQNNTINYTNNNAINLREAFNGCLIQNNIIRNTGLQPGMMSRRIDGNLHAIGIETRCDDVLIQYNSVHASGYAGIEIYNDRSICQYNFVDSSMLSLGDGGGIYSFLASAPSRTGLKILNNIVLNSLGNNLGTVNSGLNQGQGIYMDDNVGNVEIAYNTVSQCANAGIYLHNNNNMNVHDNTCYNNGNGTVFDSDDARVRTITFQNNILFGRVATQNAANFRSSFGQADTRLFGTAASINSNFYTVPIDDNLTFYIKHQSSPDMFSDMSLPMWRTYSGFDAASAKAPLTITNVNQLDFQYNATQFTVAKTLPPGNWKDVRGVNYSGTISLQPYTSFVVINTGVTNTAPTASAGIDQTIQLPTSSVNLVGSGNDPDGSISSYLWTKVSGTGGTITNPTLASTSITGLTQGVYQFKLQVTDNQGATGTDIVNITVNPANISPSANAGTDQAITLPTSATTLTGSGNDPDGNITAFGWTRISGPNTPTIVTPSGASTAVNGMIAGTYQFQLEVTDNQSATGTDIVQVIVSNSPNVAPTAGAGPDQTIQLPVNSVSLTGSGNDSDGSIVSYSWTKTSGPAATITSASSASTSVTGLVQGVYQFQLQVTDNGGLTGTDMVLITVNPANVSPTATAGTDQTITLPTSSVTLSGSANDADGSVSSHTWTKTSGTGGTITSPANYTTTVTGLVAGTYVFRLEATDNQGATGFDELTVTVNSAANVLPSANAGADQVLTWPTNSASLSGSGIDTDGSIVAYSWTKISGGVATITSPTSANTTITGMDIGVYQFQLQVQDNSGGTATDNIQITVNKGSASLAFSNLSQVYTGFPLSPTVTTTPAGLSISLTLSGTTGGKINTGSYPAVAGITDPHWNFTPISATFTITQATAIISASSATVNYDGLTHSIVATTTPSVPGLAYLYNGSASEPSAIGAYSVDITLVNSNYQASPVNVTLNIVSNPAIIFISDTTKVYNGSPQAVTVTSSWPYSLTGSPQTNAGQYVVQADINDGIHSGSATATMTIAKQAAVLSWAQPAPQPYGTKLTALILNASSNISGTWSYTYPIGTQLGIGTYGINATFTPTDAANYTGGVISRSVSIFGVNPFLDYFISSNGQFFFIEQ